MKLSRYKKFLEASSVSKLRELVELIDGHEMIVQDHENHLEVAFRIGNEFDLYTLQDLFEQIADIEKEFPDVTWQENAGDFIFEFHY